MEELDFDPDKFIIVNPIWHVVDRKSVENPDEKGIGVIRGVTSDGPYVPFFTDQHLAERFGERLGDPDAIAVPFATPRDWLFFLEFLDENGHEKIGPDPEPGKGLPIYPIAHMMRAIRAKLGQ
jgi:hypothetical protein